MITGAYGYGGPEYSEAMNQREAAEKQRSMMSRDDAMRGDYYRDPATRNMGPQAILGAEVKQRQQGGVAREMQQFEKHLNTLINVIDELDRRLATATVPQPETNNLSSVPGPDGSALTCQLFAFNSMLSRQINRLEAIYQGIDL